MPEVKRINVFMHGPNKKVDMVEAAHLDRVTAERDALQALLTAADERADQLEGLLREAWEYDIGTPLKRKIMAALKPAEGGGDDA
ncbi:hypothetical protein ACU684_11810 [Pseudomonas sp. LF135]